MSGRALRKLREEREIAARKELEDSEEDDEEVDERKTGGAFLAMMDDSSSDEYESSESDEESSQNELGSSETDGTDKAIPATEENCDSKPATTDATNDKIPGDKEEDLDALLAEFKSTDGTLRVNKESDQDNCSWFQDIVDNLDPRDLDFEAVTRSNLHVGGSAVEDPVTGSRRSRQSYLFGAAREGWGRPPHYIGGGIGMKTYEDEKAQSLPFPYNLKVVDDDGDIDEKRDWMQFRNWYKFIYSDTYKKSLDLYHEIQQTGDVNTLALFIADNPFVPEALLQLAKVAYQTNRKQEGLALLRRSLWIYECSSLNSFLPQQRVRFFLDSNLQENKAFFDALLQLVKVSSIAGCMRTALSVSRYLLSMDPLRDPTGVLLIMDYYALSTMKEEHDIFLITMVESDKIRIYYEDKEVGNSVGKLLDMPNWAYAYAMALFRFEKSIDSSKSSVRNMTSTEALVSAIQTFPSIVEQLLVKNDQDIFGRSMEIDWPRLLNALRSMDSPPNNDSKYDAVVYHASKSACDLISKHFVERSCKLWAGTDILKWLHNAAVEAVSRGENATCPSKALQRYSRFEHQTFDTREQLLPDEANPLDPSLLAMCLVVDQNRRRFLRRGDRAGRPDPLEVLENQARNGARGVVMGGRATQQIDPDSPMLEVFLQSMLPWNHVEGLPPPPP
eukprot:CAMPEP_0194207922 /NCGR_PEP_ID=MMETSP0156-20130528/6537_1 /TAXON_ID=33649 /ORGANISM="Thalassionema nitzschioides, Strain L26-B" /LENGTH=672 /DNA_ID=CAMNT_0038934797 /DNA_START=106 /DNA_END=2124 /DNA_ORIENTATION=+